MKRGSSLRFIEWPIPATSGLVLGGMARSLLAQACRGVFDGLHDVHIAGAPAQVARDGLADLELGRARVRRQQGAAGHHHARRAIAALQAVLFPESFLNGVELA